MSKEYPISLFSQSLFALPLREAIDGAARAGYAAIELACAAPHLDAETARSRSGEVASWIRDAGMAVSALSGFNRFTDGGTLDAELAAAEIYLRAAPALGTGIVKLTPGAPASALATQEHWDTLARALDRLIPVAESLDLRLAFETHMRQVTDTLAGTRRFLSLSDAPCIGLTIDFSNFAFARESVPEAVLELGSRSFNAHVKNGRIRDDGSWDFLPLDEGWTSYPDVLRALDQVGYQGYLTVECLGADAKERPLETASRDRLILERFLRDQEGTA